jgi:hypothetical protein
MASVPRSVSSGQVPTHPLAPVLTGEGISRAVATPAALPCAQDVHADVPGVGRADGPASAAGDDPAAARGSGDGDVAGAAPGGARGAAPGDAPGERRPACTGSLRFIGGAFHLRLSWGRGKDKGRRSFVLRRAGNDKNDARAAREIRRVLVDSVTRLEAAGLVAIVPELMAEATKLGWVDVLRMMTGVVEAAEKEPPTSGRPRDHYDEVPMHLNCFWTELGDVLRKGKGREARALCAGLAIVARAALTTDAFVFEHWTALVARLKANDVTAALDHYAAVHVYLGDV